jgi:hypothetical protein
MNDVPVASIHYIDALDRRTLTDIGAISPAKSLAVAAWRWRECSSGAHSNSLLLLLQTGEREPHILRLEVRVFLSTFDHDRIPPSFGQSITLNRR